MPGNVLFPRPAGKDELVNWLMSQLERPSALSQMGQLSSSFKPLDDALLHQQPVTPDMVHSAVGGALANPMVNAFMMPGIMAGSNGIGAPSESAVMGAAQQLRSGVTPESVWQKTGVAIGPGGRPRWEIDDSDAKWLAHGTYQEVKDKGLDISKVVGKDTLGGVVDHPKAFEAYPELKDMPVTTMDRLLMPGQADAAYHPKIGFAMAHDIAAGPQALPVILHEMTHAVQDIEDHPSGGSAGEDLRNALIAQTKDYGDQVGRPDLVKGEIARLKGLTNDELGMTYHQLFGEAEARLSEYRMGLNADQRRQLYPYAFHPNAGGPPYGYGLDVPPNYLIPLEQKYYRDAGSGP